MKIESVPLGTHLTFGAICIIASLAVSSLSAQPAPPDKDKPAFPSLKPVLADRIAGLEKEIAGLILRRGDTAAGAVAQQEMAIDLRIIQRWIAQRAQNSAQESPEQIVGLLRLEQLSQATNGLQEAARLTASTPPSRTQSEALIRLHQISFDLKDDANAAAMDEVCHNTALAMVNIANAAPVEASAIPVMRPAKIDNHRGGDQNSTSTEVRTLTALNDEIVHAAVSLPVRSQLLALLAETQSAVKENDKDAPRLQALLVNAVDLAKGLAGNVAMTMKTKNEIESQLAEGLALYGDSRMRAAGQSRIQGLAQYRQMMARIDRMKISPELRVKLAPAIGWAQNHVDQGGKVIALLEDFSEVLARFMAMPRTPSPIAALRVPTETAAKAVEQHRDAFITAATDMGGNSAITASPDNLEVTLADLRLALEQYQTMTALPAAIDTLNTYKPKPFGGIESRVTKNSVLAAQGGKYGAPAAAARFLADVVKLAHAADAVSAKPSTEVPAAVVTAWAGGPLTDFNTRSRTLVSELASQIAAGQDMDAKKFNRLESVPMLMAALHKAATVEAILARDDALNRWVDWGITPEIVHSLLTTYQQAMTDAFSGFVSESAGSADRFIKSRNEFAPLMALLIRDSAYIEPCSKFPVGLGGDLARLATPLDGQPFGTERYATFALQVSAMLSTTDIDGARDAATAALRRLAKDVRVEE